MTMIMICLSTAQRTTRQPRSRTTRLQCCCGRWRLSSWCRGMDPDVGDIKDLYKTFHLYNTSTQSLLAFRLARIGYIICL